MVLPNRLPFRDGELEEDVDLKGIGIKANLNFLNYTSITLLLDGLFNKAFIIIKTVYLPIGGEYLLWNNCK